MEAKKWIVNTEVKPNPNLKLKHILVWNYDYGEFIEVIYHYINYKNIDKRGIGQWNIKLKQ